MATSSFVKPFNLKHKVYPSGSMLEMSNGYPHSHSPLGGSPSPGPSPGLGGHLNTTSHNTHNNHSNNNNNNHHNNNNNNNNNNNVNHHLHHQQHHNNNNNNNNINKCKHALCGLFLVFKLDFKLPKLILKRN